MSHHSQEEGNLSDVDIAISAVFVNIIERKKLGREKFLNMKLIGILCLELSRDAVIQLAITGRMRTQLFGPSCDLYNFSRNYIMTQTNTLDNLV